MMAFMPGDWVSYQGQGYSGGRVGQVLEVNEDGTVRCGYYGRSSCSAVKLKVRWEEGYYTRKETWVSADWCRPLARTTESPPCENLWDIPEVAAVVEAWDQVDWSSRPPMWPPLVEAVEALRRPEPPLRAEDV